MSKSTDIIDIIKVRDFNGIMNDSFQFIGREGVAMGKIMFTISAIPIFIFIIAMAFLMRDFLLISVDTSYLTGTVFWHLALLAISYLLVVFALMGSCIQYINIYATEKRRDITASEVFNGLLSNSGNFMIAMLVSFFIIALGIVLLIIPGIYVSIPLMLVPFIIVHLKLDAFDSISKSFDIIKNSWWRTVGISIVSSLIIAALGFVFQLPAMIYAIINAITNGPENLINGIDSMYITFNIIAQLAKLFFMPISFIMIAFQYYSLYEMQEMSSLRQRIATINQPE